MVNRNLIRGLDLSDNEWEQELEAALEGMPPDEIDWGSSNIAVNKIVEGQVLRVEGDFVLVDVGYKSEGMILRNEWEEDEPPPEPGSTVKVLIEDIEDVLGRIDDSRGMISLSKRKAAKIEAWLKVMETVHEEDVVTGIATRKINNLYQANKYHEVRMLTNARWRVPTFTMEHSFGNPSNASYVERCASQKFRPRCPVRSYVIWENWRLASG
jgi:S1 RNA binding family protein